MTFEEVATSLPHGFHDAELQHFEMDYVHRTHAGSQAISALGFVGWIVNQNRNVTDGEDQLAGSWQGDRNTQVRTTSPCHR
jgi:hypothetical protein